VLTLLNEKQKEMKKESRLRCIRASCHWLQEEATARMKQ